MKMLIIEPNGWPCTFGECPPGYFLDETTLCLKTEYSSNEQPEKHDAYNCGGEYYWGGTNNSTDRNKITVQPCRARWVEIEEPYFVYLEQ
jgi:hypothetical protein